MSFTEQQTAIRLGQKLPRRTSGAAKGGPQPGRSQPAWYPKIGGWQTSEGYGSVYDDESDETDEDNGSWSDN